MSSTNSGVTYKLFMGFLVNGELRMNLAKSIRFKDLQILHSHESYTLQLIPFEDKEYLGFYLDSPSLSIKDAPKLESDLKMKLTDLCPDFRQGKLSLRIFSQPFIH